ncbi:hypothetical protein AC579_2091 [Pseudocercospora musae]|uniref:Uncharacterized protein n=1 Tax=Pseudocercospora musae TaxID=113226 RepID=A0A139ICS7_9PEZI|nr:hypothetical protein AC579_2091 [Pseudocercospora musae]KXT12568.1 hypothetical protein AC579_2091 [Pseudocercospora musae]
MIFAYPLGDSWHKDSSSDRSPSLAAGEVRRLKWKSGSQSPLKRDKSDDESGHEGDDETSTTRRSGKQRRIGDEDVSSQEPKRSEPGPSSIQANFVPSAPLAIGGMNVPVSLGVRVATPPVTEGFEMLTNADAENKLANALGQARNDSLGEGAGPSTGTSQQPSHDLLDDVLD